MNKKIISALTAVLLICQTAGFAAYDISTTENKITVSGECDAYQNVSVVLLNSDKLGCADAESTAKKYYKNIDDGVKMTSEEIVYYTNIRDDGDGKWEQVVPMGEVEKMNLTLITNTGECDYIEYTSITYRQSMIPRLKSSASVSDTALSETITEYISYISGKKDLYLKLFDKEPVASFNKAMIAELSETEVSAFDILQKGIDSAIMVEAVKEGLITDFATAVSIFDYDAETAAQLTDEGVEKVIELLKGVKYKSVADYAKKASVQIALQALNYNKNSTGENLADLIKENNDVLELDLDDFNKLSKSDRANAAKKLAAKKCEDTEAAQDKLDDIVKELNKKVVVGGGGGGSSSSPGRGSSTGSTVYTGSTQVSVSDNNIRENKRIYTDIYDAEWAYSAIESLSGKGIINGYDDGSFRPNNNITRAEFIKMVVQTFFDDAKHERKISFSDVAENAWYADAVNIAYSEGIISGNDKNQFMPESNITRQDMSVIIYNAAVKFNLISAADEYEAFSDDGVISDYAKAPVYTLKNYQIINGVGDGLFAPKDNATRASAAQIIYTMVNKFN